MPNQKYDLQTFSALLVVSFDAPNLVVFMNGLRSY
jgi:hypothetical protein